MPATLIPTLDTPAARAARVDAWESPIYDRVVTLAARWEDEREYEDWKDYDAALRAAVAAADPALGLTVVRTQRRPVGVVVRDPALPYDVLIYCGARDAGWKSVKR